MNKEIKRVVTVFSICLLILIPGTPFALVANGNGTGGGAGNGTGGKTDISLTVTSSSIKNGDTNVPLNPVIDLHFNKNVVNLTVKSNNSRCFHLADRKGNSVTIKIIFPDDQLKPQYREHIFITPKQNLAPNSKYTLYIDKTLQAKNKKFIDNPHIIAFTTGETVSTAVNPSLKDLAKDVEVCTNKLPVNRDSYLLKGKTNSAANKTAMQSKKNKYLTAIITGIILAVAILFVIIYLLAKRKDKDNHSDHT